MQITYAYDPVRQVLRYELEISERDLFDAYCNFTAWDKLLLRDCRKSQNIADWLLALETIVRKIEQVQAQKQKTQIAEVPSDETREVWFIAV